MELGDITGGDAGALEGVRAGSGRGIEAGREDDKGDMAIIASGDVRESILMGG